MTRTTATAAEPLQAGRTWPLVLVWLAAITAANLVTAAYGPDASILTSFAFVGLTLTTRDLLHDSWRQYRAPRMALLIIAGSTLAWLVTPDAGRIGVASGVAFAAAETADALVYHAARSWDWLRRSNTSNLVGAAVDSLVFPTIAFGGLLWHVTAAQFGAKVAGALIFTLILTVRRRPAGAVA